MFLFSISKFPMFLFLFSDSNPQFMYNVKCLNGNNFDLLVMFCQYVVNTTYIIVLFFYTDGMITTARWVIE